MSMRMTLNAGFVPSLTARPSNLRGNSTSGIREARTTTCRGHASTSAICDRASVFSKRVIVTSCAIYARRCDARKQIDGRRGTPRMLGDGSGERDTKFTAGLQQPVARETVNQSAVHDEADGTHLAGRGGWRNGGRSRRGGGGNGNGDEGSNNGDFWGPRDIALCGAIAFEVKGASRINYSIDKDTGEPIAQRVNAKNSRGRAFEEIRLFFLPEGFPESVGPSYAKYSFWRCIQNVISAMTAVMSTQALLSAVGLGPSTSRSVAAATSWVLKDGFGSFGKLITARMGVAFDSESKMYRLASDILFDLGISLELVTPLFPGQFLVLAAMGNFVKSVSMTIGMACRNSVLSTFVLRENLGDISAKNDAQNTIANLTGLGLGIGALRVLPESAPIRLATFWVLTSVYSLLNYQSMKSVTLTTLNRQRAGLVIDAFLRGKPLPSPTYVNKHERIIPFVKPRFSEPRLRLGAPLSSLEDGLEASVKSARRKGERFILDMSPSSVNVVLHRDANADDMLEAFLAYMHLRRSMGDRLQLGRCRGVSTFDEGRLRCTPQARRLWTAFDPASRFAHLEESKTYAKRHVATLKKEMAEAGYNVGTLLFAPDRRRAVY